MDTINSKQPSASIIRKYLAYDTSTGIIRRAFPYQGVKVGDVAGTTHENGYVEISLFRRRYPAGVLAWVICKGEWPSYFIDHKNGNPSDNRIDNLRDITPKQNSQNQRRAQSRNKSTGVLGVTMTRSGSFEARIVVNGRNLYLGSFNSKDTAAAAYIEAKRVHHPGCTI